MKQLIQLLLVLFVGSVMHSQITAAEYFIDTDPGVGNAASLSVAGNLINQNFTIPTAGLSDGVHKLHVRVVKDDGTWSLYAKNVFYISSDTSNTANIASAEYFIDSDPGVGNATSLSVAGTIIDQNFTIPTTGLSDGIHSLHIRVINDDGTWGLYDRNVFYVNPNNSNAALITAAEYFFDIDPGFGSGTAIELDDVESMDEDFAIEAPLDLSEGVHFLYVRVQNTDGDWSLYASANSVTILSTPDSDFQNFEFYPNPVKDVLHFEVENQEIIDFKVIDLFGKVVMEKRPLENQIDLSVLSSGAYLFHLKTNVGTISKKFIKQ